MTMKYNFDKIPNRRGTNSLKWELWIAKTPDDGGRYGF